MLTIEEAIYYYNMEAGHQGLQHWAYPYKEKVMLVRHYEGPEIMDHYQLATLLDELRQARHGSLRE